MVAHAAKKNSRGKKMKTIDKDTTSAPNNPIEEGIGTAGMGGTTPPLSVDEAPITKSTPWHIVQREEKKKSVQKTGLTVALVVPMLQQLAKDVQEYIMPSEDWTKCM